MAIPPTHLLSQMEVRGKRPAQKTPVNSTPPSPLAPVGLMAFTVLQDPTVRQQLHPPSITSTPLGLSAPQQWQSTSEESRHLLASLYTSPGFNLPGQPVAGLGNLMPSIPSLAGSHHMFSTWPASVFTSGPPSPHLTIDQTNSLYKLAAECQVLGVKLATKFQVLLGLETMHHNSIQGMAHETLTLGHSA